LTNYAESLKVGTYFWDTV